MLNRLLKRPDWLFLIFAAPVGLVLCFLVPPMGGGNEMYNFQRIASIAYGQPLVGPASVPRGIADFVAEGFAYFHEGLTFPLSFPADEHHRMAAIALRADESVVMPPNPIAVHHPFSYLLQVPLFRLAAATGAAPLTLLYLSRLAGLVAALGLTFLAIRLMPSHKYALAALALLPPITFGRSTVDADPVTNGLAFLFIACVLREAVRTDAIRLRSLVTLAVLGFVMGQCKSAYFVLLVLPLVIPKVRFANRMSRSAWLAVLILPGILASIAWMVLVKQAVLAGATYHTWSGAVNPDRQLAMILADPANYVATIFRTLFLTPFFPRSLFQVAGSFGPPVMLDLTLSAVILALLLGATLSDAVEAPAYPRSLAWLTAAIFAGFVGLTLTLLYLQWTGLGADVVDGFQGRYLYPLLPLLLVLARARRRAFSIAPALWLLATAVVGLSAMMWLTVQTYHASTTLEGASLQVISTQTG